MAAISSIILHYHFPVTVSWDNAANPLFIAYGREKKRMKWESTVSPLRNKEKEWNENPRCQRRGIRKQTMRIMLFVFCCKPSLHKTQSVDFFLFFSLMNWQTINRRTQCCQNSQITHRSQKVFHSNIIEWKFKQLYMIIIIILLDQIRCNEWMSVMWMQVMNSVSFIKWTYY